MKGPYKSPLKKSDPKTKARHFPDHIPYPVGMNDNPIPERMMTQITAEKLSKKMTQEKADKINDALCAIFDIRAGHKDPSTYDLHQNVLMHPSIFSLRCWLEATDFIDDWNKKEQRRARLEDRDPRFVRTLAEGFIASIFAFMSYPVGEPIVTDGKHALGIVDCNPEEINPKSRIIQ